MIHCCARVKHCIIAAMTSYIKTTPSHTHTNTKIEANQSNTCDNPCVLYMCYLYRVFILRIYKCEIAYMCIIQSSPDLKFWIKFTSLHDFFMSIFLYFYRNVVL